MSVHRRPAGSELHADLRAWPSFVLEEVARIVRQRVVRALAEDGAPSWDGIAILSVLAASPRGVLRQAALRERTGIDRTTLTPLLMGFEEDFLLERRRDPADGRQFVVEITEHGRAEAADARARIAAAELQAMRPLRAAEQRRLHQLLERLLPRPQTGVTALFFDGQSRARPE